MRLLLLVSVADVLYRNVQYALLHLGIMEYKFGHSFNALSVSFISLADANSTCSCYN